jgi:hypothetical protein
MFKILKLCGFVALLFAILAICDTRFHQSLILELKSGMLNFWRVRANGRRFKRIRIFSITPRFYPTSLRNREP